MTLYLMNPNSNAGTTQAMLGIARRVLPQLVGWTAPSGPGMIIDAPALERAGALVAAADLPGARGVIVSAFGDPGRGALAARLDCPVVGIGQAAAAAAGQGGRRFAVVTTTPGLKTQIDALMGDYVGCFLTQGDPLALMQDAGALDAALLDGIAAAARAGAQAAIIGGGPLGEAAERLAAHSPIPLVAPIRAAVEALWTQVQD
ncbi:aspartate/glutamate racemase family protein [Salipiger sp. 1_MG-2023]|uniref:aspartate/glutamate racemase family protein n=1 Tax=Salipiger sp. 1_MG-2023 TaxID=3062665 RepID=UPI0026E23B24|nr:aspartate/glutamate racemase family protein [Salipiger sp. 1_MG-2023]MDO6585076.1 aspartate/glutamate racemase family protein [Salipiger sp. 1_MG-2023]